MANVSLRCRVHNPYRAREHFGARHTSQFTRRARTEVPGPLFETMPTR